jgi:hypothetical protein
MPPPSTPAVNQDQINAIKFAQANKQLPSYLLDMDPYRLYGLIRSGGVVFDKNGQVLPTASVKAIIRAKQATAFPGLKADANAKLPSEWAYVGSSLSERGPEMWNGFKNTVTGIGKVVGAYLDEQSALGPLASGGDGMGQYQYGAPTTFNFAPVPVLQKGLAPEIKAADQRSMPVLRAAVQGIKTQGVTGAIYQGSKLLAKGDRAGALAAFKSAPAKFWEGAEQDPISFGISLAAGFGALGGALDTGAAIASRAALVDDSIDLAVQSGNLSKAAALQARQTAAQNLAQKLSTMGAQAKYFAAGGATGAYLRGPMAGLIKKYLYAGHEQRALKQIGKGAADTSAIKSPQHAQAVVDAVKGRMQPVDAKEFSEAFSANHSRASLSEYTPEELKKMALYKLKGARIYYGIKDIAKHEITGMPEKDIIGVINNDDGLPGVATPAVMLHAIENGATTLDAWDVGGFLPRRYERFGFKEIGRSEYDPSYGEPSAELKAAWKNSGWKDGTPYPSVVYMKYGGLDGIGPDRRAVRTNYQNAGTVEPGGTPGDAGPRARSIFRSDGGTNPASRPGRIREGTGPSGASDQGANSGKSGVLKPDSFTRTLRSLRGMSDADLRSLGLDPRDIRNLKE